MSLHDFHRVQERLKSVADPVGFLVNLFTHAPVGFAVWSADGHAMLTNQAFMDLFGVEPPPEYNVLEDELLAENGMLALFKRAFAGETVHVPTFWYDPRDLKSISVSEGHRVAISMTIFPLFKANGEIDCVAATYKDETEFMLAHDLLWVSEERQRLAHQAARVGTFEWNVQTGLNVWSPELEAMHGLEPGEFGKTQPNWEQLVHPDDRATAVALVAEAMESFLPVEGEWRVVWSDRSVRWLFARFQVFTDEAGKAHRLMGVNVDITARKNAEQEIRRLNENLERLVQERTLQLSVANRELEAFSYSVAHDLRAPLRGISGFCTILIEDYADKLDQEGQRHLKRVVDGAERMGQLIDALLSLSRLTRVEVRREAVDLTELARAVIAQLRTNEPDRVVEFVTSEKLTTTGDPHLVRLLLENLLGNAWKFTAKKSPARIELGCEQSRGSAVYFVRDNGAGFDMANADKLFIPFSRLHRASDFEGTGVGLATVLRIVRRHGGQAWAEAAEDRGATFRFTLE